jgi:hypothetical protein
VFGFSLEFRNVPVSKTSLYETVLVWTVMLGEAGADEREIENGVDAAQQVIGGSTALLYIQRGPARSMYHSETA